MDFDSWCITSAVDTGPKKSQSLSHGVAMTYSLDPITQTAATVAKIEGQLMAAFVAGKCPEVKMLITGLLKPAKVEDATEAKYTDGYKIKNSIKLGEGFPTAS